MAKDNSGARFTEREKALVLDLVDEWKEIIEDKKTDYGTNTKKDDAWDSIAVVFNASEGAIQRTAKQLRDWWKNSKARSKKEMTSKTRSLRKTGGGGPSSPLSAEASKVSSIVPSQMTSLKNPYDCDGDEDVDLFFTPPTHQAETDTSSKRKASNPIQYSIQYFIQVTAKESVPKRRPFCLKLRAPSTSSAALSSSTGAKSPTTSSADLTSNNLEDGDTTVSIFSSKAQPKSKHNTPKEARLTLLDFEEKEHCIRLETLQMENETAARLREKADFEFDAIKKEHALRMEVMQAQLQSLKTPPPTWNTGDQSSYTSASYYQPNYHSL